MNVPLIFLNKTNLLSSITVNVIPTACKIVTNNDQFKSLAVLYDKYFKCLEQERCNGALYIKLATTICNFSDFSMLIVYRNNNSNIAQFVGYITRLVITKHVDFISGDFNKDSSNDWQKISLQSLDQRRLSRSNLYKTFTKQVLLF